MQTLNIFIQSIVPQHFLSLLAGKLASIRTPWIKNLFIRFFVNKYKIDMSEYLISDPLAYDSFNQFFIRHLDMRFRPIDANAQAIVSPADGTIAQIARIQRDLLIQAKDYYFDLISLLGNDAALATTFYDGHFATLYLAPRDYHRVHMPFTGKLIKTIFVPGRLFSVNRMTCELVPNLFSRNERLICVFETAHGKMVVILIGALIVGSIQPVWMNEPIKTHAPETKIFDQPLTLNKGDELGHFQLGSTVLVLFEKESMAWESNLSSNHPIKVGQRIGKTT